MYKTRKQSSSKPIHVHSESVMIESILITPSKQTVVDEDGCTPLMNECVYGNEQSIVDALLSNDIDYQDEDGWSALMYAAYNNKPEVVSLLLKANANTDLKTKNGKNSRWLAYSEGHEDVVRILDEHFRAQL
jgi:ankyrin repeat protein